MEGQISLEMILYGATSFGGSLIHIGENKEDRSELWKTISVLLTGFLFGMAFTIPTQEALESFFKNIHIGEGSRIGIALVLGLLTPYVPSAIKKVMKAISLIRPQELKDYILELLKRIFNLKYVTLSKATR